MAHFPFAIGRPPSVLPFARQPGYFLYGGLGQTDPSRIQSADISSTIYDPLVRSVRQRLKRHPIHNVHSGIPVVYSTKVPSISLFPLPRDEFEKEM